MTDSAGTPAEPDDSAHRAAGDGSGTGGGRRGGGRGEQPGKGLRGLRGPSRPGRRGEPGKPGKEGKQSRRRGLRWGALGVSLLVLLVSSVGWWLYRRLEGNITTDLTAVEELERYDRERPLPAPHGARNILLIGSDSRAGPENGKYGRDKGVQHSDTTILLHIAGDRRSVTAVSVPRDLMVGVPSCRTAQGTRSAARHAQFNRAFAIGGAACTIRTVERLTGVRIDHHMVVDFHGFTNMVDAVGGVTVCLPTAIDDRDARLELGAGRQTLDGEQALGYVRVRKSLGNGSDTERMDRQQQFLGALFDKVQSNGVLLNPARLYPVLDAATRSLTTDPGLASLKDLFDLARSLRGVPTDRVQFLTVPRRSHPGDPNRDVLAQPAASRLFERLRKDAPVRVVPSETTTSASGDTERDTLTGSRNPSATPTFPGTSATAAGCG
ncbi:LCP family protein [Streptomyces pacificus]|uniref:LCP family protein n=1 Tax=Streptomyces pacificus TaxID=2705029 RepID=A0A6A0AWP6_9ACTN|nr:LCP family protein [Streptomyces pacificus]GFH37370.1 LCP family protein [Streptomyces pacificus]